MSYLFNALTSYFVHLNTIVKLKSGISMSILYLGISEGISHSFIPSTAHDLSNALSVPITKISPLYLQHLFIALP
jgi:hypothetical protein